MDDRKERGGEIRWQHRDELLHGLHPSGGSADHDEVTSHSSRLKRSPRLLKLEVSPR